MSRYTDHLALEPYGKMWVNRTPFSFDVGYKGSGATVIIPKGVLSDLATIPWYARPFIRTADARFAKASFLHDHMLKQGWSPQVAAACFYDALRADDVPAFTAGIMFLAVLWRTWK